MTALAMKWGQEDYPWISEEARSTWVARNERAFAQLRDAIARLPTKPTAWPDETLHARTLDAIVGLDDGTTSPQDVAALATAVLRRQMSLGASSSVSLVVPAATPWPTPADWETSGGVVQKVAAASHQIWASPWVPSWVRDATSAPPHVDIDTALERRLSSEPRAADPFFTELTGHESYFSDGQRLAVRAVITSAPDSTTLVVLPTGSGKTAVAHATALLAHRRGTALVIVPTTALALDQERAFRDLLRKTRRQFANEDFAYHSGLTDEERGALRERIRAGEQPIVFAAPESVERSLAYSLYEAAEYGLITAFVVDEAHVVSEWGDEFRPEFQTVGGLRRGLLRAARQSQSGPFRTLLLTATPTQEAVTTLTATFVDPGQELGVVAAAELRLEPTYWAVRFDDQLTRERAVVEAIRHLPRPLLLYATKVDDSKHWVDVLRAAGFGRVALVNGETPSRTRSAVLDGWRGVTVDGRSTRRTSYDVVVATSAFGLGVDQEDVRAVIHACIPETVDRFYQEVGRGGRDGRASLSLVLYCQSDMGAAKSINRTKLISRELAEPRLRAMLVSAQSMGADRWRVDLAALPPQTPHKRSYNLQWNQRTINLLVRAGAVAWDGERPILADSVLGDEGDPEAWGAIIRLLRADHQSSSFWDAVEATRARRLNADSASLDRMMDALLPDAPVHSILCDAYRVDVADGHRLDPAESCGGCPWCREHQLPFLAGGAVPLSTVRSAINASHRLERLVGGRNAGLILFASSDPAWQAKVQDATQLAVEMGTTCVVLDRGAIDIDVTRLHKLGPSAAVFIEEPESLDLRDLPDVPTLYVRGPTESVTSEVLEGGLLVPRRRLILAESGSPDPSRPDRLLRDVRPWTSIDRFLEAG